MNINLSLNGKNSACPLVKKWKEFITTFGLKQLIKQPTRITTNSSSLIDHVLTNTKDKISNSGILDIGLSDHQLIFCTRKLTRTKTDLSRYI